MTTNTYHVTSDVVPIHDYNAIKEFLEKWEFSITPDVVADDTHPLHNGTPVISINSEYGPPLMITHKTDRSKQEHEFYTGLCQHITTPMVITEKQIHPTINENNIHINPETGVEYG